MSCTIRVIDNHPDVVGVVYTDKLNRIDVSFRSIMPDDYVWSCQFESMEIPGTSYEKPLILNNETINQIFEGKYIDDHIQSIHFKLPIKCVRNAETMKFLLGVVDIYGKYKEYPILLTGNDHSHNALEMNRQIYMLDNKISKLNETLCTFSQITTTLIIVVVGLSGFCSYNFFKK